MSKTRSLVLFSLCLQAVLVALPERLAARPAPAFDKGLLETSYFGGPREFREADEIDYLWVKEGFAIDGRVFQLAPWEAPTLLDGGRDGEDRRLATEISAGMQRLLLDAVARGWRGKASASLEAGDVRVEGRIVDCSRGNDAAKILIGFGAGSGNTTFDLKMIDARTGELLVAMHHRVVSGTSWSSTESKLAGWLEDWAESVGKRGFTRLYEKGDRVHD